MTSHLQQISGNRLMSEKRSDADTDKTSNVWSSELKFRYSTDQVLEYARLMDFLYGRQISVMRDLLKIVIVRAVAQTQISVGHGSNVLSLSDSLDIPRETARRKCDELIKDGCRRNRPHSSRN